MFIMFSELSLETYQVMTHMWVRRSQHELRAAIDTEIVQRRM